MRAMDGLAKEKGVTLLCELGLDPGIDHMSASKTIEEIHEKDVYKRQDVFTVQPRKELWLQVPRGTI